VKHAGPRTRLLPPLAEHIERLTAMASGDATWDLSPNDREAIRAVLDSLRQLGPPENERNLRVGELVDLHRGMMGRMDELEKSIERAMKFILWTAPMDRVPRLVIEHYRHIADPERGWAEGTLVYEVSAGYSSTGKFIEVSLRDALEKWITASVQHSIQERGPYLEKTRKEVADLEERNRMFQSLLEDEDFVAFMKERGASIASRE
jgi:hypothetical protein